MAYYGPMFMLLGAAWNSLLSTSGFSSLSQYLSVSEFTLHRIAAIAGGTSGYSVFDDDNDDKDGDDDDDGRDRYIFDPQDFAPLPIAFGAMTVLWTALLLIWIAHIVFYNRKYPFPLHKILCVLPISKMISLVLGVVFYRDCVAYGTPGDFTMCRRRWPYLVYDLSGAFFLVMLLLVLSLLSKGYCITRRSFDQQEQRALVWNLSVVGACRVAYSMSSYFVFPMVVMCVIFIGHIFSGIVLNVRLLWLHLVYYRDTFAQRHPDVYEELQRRNIDAKKDNPAVRKLALFRRLQYIVSFAIAFIFLIVITNVVIVLQRATNVQRMWVWFNPLLFEIMIIFVACVLMFVFRLRDFSKYAPFNVISLEEMDSQDIEIVIDDEPQQRQQEEEEMEQQPLLFNLATSPPSRHKGHRPGGTYGSGDEAPVIVIQNPSHYQPHLGQKRPPAQRAHRVQVFVALTPEEPPSIRSDRS